MKTMDPRRYPHMISLKPVSDAGLAVLRVTDHAITVATATDRTTTQLGWTNLILAATQSDDDLRSVYAALHVIAAQMLRKLPRREQGLSVVVTDRGTSAVWAALVTDAAGCERSDLLRADEGMQQPHRWMAEQEAREIRRRLG